MRALTACAVPRTLPPLVGVEVAAAQRRGGQLADAGKHLRGAMKHQCWFLMQLILDHMNSIYVSVAILGVHNADAAELPTETCRSQWHPACH